MGLISVDCVKCGRCMLVSDKPERSKVYVCSRKSCRRID
jgi:hypothetical protein